MEAHSLRCTFMVSDAIKKPKFVIDLSPLHDKYFFLKNTKPEPILCISKNHYWECQATKRGIQIYPKNQQQKRRFEKITNTSFTLHYNFYI